MFRKAQRCRQYRQSVQKLCSSTIDLQQRCGHLQEHPPQREARNSIAMGGLQYLQSHEFQRRQRLNDFRARRSCECAAEHRHLSGRDRSGIQRDRSQPGALRFEYVGSGLADESGLWHAASGPVAAGDAGINQDQLLNPARLLADLSRVHFDRYTFGQNNSREVTLITHWICLKLAGSVRDFLVGGRLALYYMSKLSRRNYLKLLGAGAAVAASLSSS